MLRALAAAPLFAFFLAGLGCHARRAPEPAGEELPAPVDLPTRIQTTLENGARMSFERKFKLNLPKSFGFTGDETTAFEIAEAHVTKDHRQRAFLVVLNPEGGAASIMLMTVEWDLEARTKEDLYMHLSTAGEWLLGLSCDGKIDETGGYVQGSCVLQPLDPDAEGTKTLLQRELDFWLKGVGRKARPPRPPIEWQPAGRAPRKP